MVTANNTRNGLMPAYTARNICPRIIAESDGDVLYTKLVTIPYKGSFCGFVGSCIDHSSISWSSLPSGLYAIMVNRYVDSSYNEICVAVKRILSLRNDIEFYYVKTTGGNIDIYTTRKANVLIVNNQHYWNLDATVVHEAVTTLPSGAVKITITD